MIDRLKSAFSREAAELRESVDDLGERMNDDLTKREADLGATPEQKLDGILDEIGSNDSVFDDLRTKTHPTEGTDPQ